MQNEATPIDLDLWPEARTLRNGRRFKQAHDALETMNMSDLLAYEIFVLVAEELRARPRETLDRARRMLGHWRPQPGRRTAVHAWETLLSYPVPTIVATVLEFSDQGQWLRSTSPFSGAVPEEKRLRLMNELRHRYHERLSQPGPKFSR